MQNKRPIFSHLDQKSLVNKEFIVWPKRECLLTEPTLEITHRQKWAHLVCLGSQSECRICFILPASGFSHIMKRVSGQLGEVVADKNWVTGGPFREEVLKHLGNWSFITSQRGVGVFRKVIITYKNCTPPPLAITIFKIHPPSPTPSWPSLFFHPWALTS